MLVRPFVILAAFLFLVLPPRFARAECVEDFRKVSFDKENHVRLRSFDCRLEAGKPNAVRIEFHRLSPTVAGLLLAGGTTTMLGRAIGNPKVLSNDVWRAYASLNEKFGEVEKVPGKRSGASSGIILNSERNDAGAASRWESASADDVIDLKKFRHTEHERQVIDFPAVAEISQLLKKKVPGDLNYTFETQVDCDVKKEPMCLKFKKEFLQISFWRPLRPADAANFAASAKDYNARLMKIRKNAEFMKEDLIDAEPPRLLKMMTQLAGDRWPDDFILLKGAYSSAPRAMCGDEGAAPKVVDLDGVDGWRFSIEGRLLDLDIALVENLSPEPLVIDALLGKRAGDARLRAASDTEEPGGTAQLDKISETLAPGGRLLVPTRIVLSPFSEDDEEESQKFRGAEEESLRKAVDARLREKGFEMEGDQFKRSPRRRNYVFGPEILLGGVVANGKPLTLLRRHAANMIDLTVTPETGSCPYLLAWDEVERDWVNEGKILHEAPSADRAYAETRRYEGLETRFRIEEREPEIARLSGLRLRLALASGESLTLLPKRPLLAGGRLDLGWGEAAEIEFALPGTVQPSQVVESELTVEGYYQRYSGMAVNEAREGATCRRPALGEGGL